MRPTDARKILDNYNAGQANEEEKALLEAWYLQQFVGDDLPKPGDLLEDKLRSWQLLNLYITEKRTIPLWPKLVVAATALLILSAAGYFLFAPEAKHRAQVSEIIPGGNRATLTLSNGQTVLLNDAKVGLLANQGSASIRKTADGQIIYDQSLSENNQLTYNIMTTPRGGQYKLTLCDGTKVWLNAASSLKFPVQFGEKERRVELSGEAYFEVTHDSAKPFRVISNRQEIQVVGTRFNVEAYRDETTTTTTLLQGLVQISSNGTRAVLKPGQTAVSNPRTALAIEAANTEAVTAWQKGMFILNDEDVRTIMRKAARWYDIDVEYRGEIPSKHLWGTISIYKDLTELLDNITIPAGLHYKLEGRRVILMK